MEQKRGEEKQKFKKKGGQAGSRDECLKKGGRLEPPLQTMVYAPVPLKHSIFLISPFILWMVLPFITFIPHSNKMSYTLTQSSSWKMQFCLSLYGVLLPSVMKGVIRFMFMVTLSTLWETVNKKIKRLVADYWLTFWLTFCLHYTTCTITYIITITGF